MQARDEALRAQLRAEHATSQKASLEATLRQAQQALLTPQEDRAAAAGTGTDSPVAGAGLQQMRISAR